ncbi:MAG: cobalamin B12-binding domain-containing protein [Candidatus Omnitrophica bacterium]|nr:cobalamin B12-binding domain-containing protein [Candidatus Omnitrophota bacterium]
MSILLVNPPRIIEKGNIWKKIDRALPPLGLACIASYLERNAQNVHILDLQAEQMNPDQYKHKIREIRPDFIGITSTTVEIKGALNIAKLSKEILPETKIVFGGAHPSILPDEVLSDSHVDFVIRGEGERTLHELMTGFKNIDNIKGLSYKLNGVIKHNPSRLVIENLDEMPMPAYQLLPMDKYKPSLGNYKRLPAISMIANRGCPGRCTFCYTGISGKKIRTRSASKLIDEIQMLQKDYGIREISFYDDTFTALQKNITEFCERMIKENIDITWSCMSRVDFVNEKMLRLMKKAGCHQIGYGLESASPEILKNIGKSTSLIRIREAVRLTKKAGINVRAMFMLGNPGETEETLEQTINFALGINPDIVIFNITTPLPGTEMYNWAKKNGYLLNVSWDKFDLANVVMRLPTVSSETIMKSYHYAYKRFYMRPAYIMNCLFKMRSLSDLKNNVRTFVSLLSFNAERRKDLGDNNVVNTIAPLR